ncbi:UPF0398 protein [Leuconostoc litchii]|uniref:UPF0398 protein ESZ47_03860 n=1 Tax=Leuconostoc litchii TaxID=1981069 RepID=A0A6P2CPG6_9LACO|nr:DUF1273 domain-containing protein [Leuconostoc litchii]TYC47283.1 DUF1273 domain-containing protein [Leuconostoc litchii]GMA69272.1 UPF0398 protein [Leuconostoc litchii]
MRLWVTGYRSYEIGTFGDNDPKIKILKYAIQQELKQQLENGLEWVITGAQLGIEQWTIEVVSDMKKEYPDLKLAMMLPFAQFGSQWNENNQAKLQKLSLQSDFSENVSNKPFQGPMQLKNYQKFMLEHTDGALFIYDTEFEGKTSFDYQVVTSYQLQTPYPLIQIDMDQLQEYATEFSEKIKDSYD